MREKDLGAETAEFGFERIPPLKTGFDRRTIAVYTQQRTVCERSEQAARRALFTTARLFADQGKICKVLFSKGPPVPKGLPVHSNLYA